MSLATSLFATLAPHLLAFSFLAFFRVLFTIVFVFVCLLLILLVLLQKGRGGGLTGALGGGGGNTAFGSKTGDVLTWATSIIFGVFLLLAIILNMLGNAQSAQSKAVAKEVPLVPPADQMQMQPPADQTAPTQPPGKLRDPNGFGSLTPPTTNPLSPLAPVAPR